MNLRFACVIAVALAALHLDAANETNAPSTPPARPAHWAARIDRPGLPNFYQVTTNLYRGAQPSARGMAELKAMGIKTVVNLRAFHSDHNELVGIDAKQGRFPMRPWRAEDKDIIGFLKLAMDTNNFPVFVHCQRGADRTGLACAMYRVVACGWTKQEAIREMKDGGFGFNPAWKNLVQYVEEADLNRLHRRLASNKD